MILKLSSDLILYFSGKQNTFLKIFERDLWSNHLPEQRCHSNRSFSTVRNGKSYSNLRIVILRSRDGTAVLSWPNSLFDCLAQLEWPLKCFSFLKGLQYEFCFEGAQIWEMVNEILAQDESGCWKNHSQRIRIFLYFKRKYLGYTFLEYSHGFTYRRSL